MGKRIISQARGRGSLTYRTRKKAFRISVSYPSTEGIGRVEKLINVSCYKAPVAKIRIDGKVFYNIAAEGIYEGQEVSVGKKADIIPGNITQLANIPIGTEIFSIETVPGDGPKLVRASGLNARITKKSLKAVYVLLPSKKEKIFSPNARATVGVTAASGRHEKPLLKAGKKYHMAKAIGGRIYPRTSAVKMNVVDHPFGSGRGKRIKSKIAKRNAPPGRKVGLLRPRRTGKRK
ncbi:MAG: 50S ribosomal protein L2 [Candidatus Pacearchaeota archaeon]|nr:MAG: 50S ribosomal protein L2 [Candidatus Pacearchaeota archaeon]